MQRAILPNDVSTWLGVLASLLFAAFLWYFLHIFRPYAKIPSYRLDFRLPFWLFKKKPLNTITFNKLINVARKNEKEGIFAMWLGLPYLVIYNDDILKMIANAQAAVDKPDMYKLFEFALGKTILTSNGERWSKFRKQLNPAFHTIALKEYMPVFNKNAAILVKQMSEKKSQPTDETIDFLLKWSVQNVLESMCGIQEGETHKSNRRIAEVIDEIFDFILYRFWSPWLYYDFALRLFPHARKMMKIVDEGKKLTREVLDATIESIMARQVAPEPFDVDPECGRGKPKSVIEILLEEHLSDPSFSMRDLENQINVMIPAGFHTVAYQTMWCLFLLGLHPEVQERAFQEVTSETEEGDVRYEDLRNLTYLECVIKETERLYPVIPITPRHLSKDLVHDGNIIPKNTTIALFIYMIHRNAEIYPDPEKFDPERFMEKNSKIRPWNYMPFGEGTRTCIGKNYAMMELKIALAHVLRNFKVKSLTREEDVELNWTIVLSCTEKLRMQFVSRQNGVTHDI